MRIDFTVWALRGGGAERVLVLIANKFAELGHMVRIITFNDGADYELHQSVEHVRLHEGFAYNHNIRSINNLYRFYKQKSNRPDVLIAFMSSSGFISIIAGKLRGLKVICSEHINHTLTGDFIRKFTIKYLYKFADKITVLTKFDSDFYQRKGLNTIVMPNPSTFELADLSMFPILQREKSILAGGNLDRYHHKGFDNLLRLIQPILKQNKEWKLLLMGGGETGKQILTDLAKELGIDKQVKFLGFTRDVQAVMRKAQIFVLSSRYEGLPMVLIEALSQGMACISYDCITGPSEMIVDRKNGLLIENQNQLKMQEGLNELLANDELRAKLSQEGIISLEKFSMPSIINKWMELFHELKLLEEKVPE